MLIAALAVTVFLAAAPAARAEWVWPVRGEVITPYRNGADPYAAGQHRGIDIAAPIGTPVVAASGGEVRFAGTAGSSGLTVSIRTADGVLDTSYLHLSATAVKKGDRVSTGDRIGAVGTTGKRSATAPHLHVGIRDAGTRHAYHDPLGLLPPAPPPSERPRPAPAPKPAPVPFTPTPEPAPVPFLPEPQSIPERSPHPRPHRIPRLHRIPRGSPRPQANPRPHRSAPPHVSPRPLPILRPHTSPAPHSLPRLRQAPATQPRARPFPYAAPVGPHTHHAPAPDPRAAPHNTPVTAPERAPARRDGPRGAPQAHPSTRAPGPDLGYALACIGLLLAAAILGLTEDGRQATRRNRARLTTVLRPVLGRRS